VEKIVLIHSFGRVYYHHYPYFLSKLTKEGKVSRRGKNASAAKANATQTFFVCKKKESHAVTASTTAAITPTLVDPTCKPPYRCKRRLCSTSALSTERTQRQRRIRNGNRILHALKTCACDIKTWPEQPRLWTNACISTAADVQNSRFFLDRLFCPTSVQHRYNACPANPEVRKPLTL
jgi:hypothetical protein